MASITDFLGGFRGGTRVNRFKINAQNCPYLGTGDIEIHIRATSFPEMDILPFPVNYKGKTINIPAVRNFVPWIVTVMDDVRVGAGDASSNPEENLHKKFMDWSDSIVDTGETYGVRRLGSAIKVGQGDDAAFSGNGNIWTITHLDHLPTETALKTFKMYNCWPIQVGPIQLDMNENARISMFNVTLAYSHIEDS